MRVTPASATRPNAVSEWCDTPRCRGRESASEIRSAPMGCPPSTLTALQASPAATPENPHGVPVPRLPGPCVTIARSALSTCLAASSPVCTETASRSPPNAWPTVTTPASDRASPPRVRENPAASAPPSVIT